MTNYIPFLKAKSNEIIALGELDTSISKKITPFLDYPKRNGGEDPIKFKSSAERLSKSIDKHIGNLDEFYFDNYDIDSNFNVDGQNNYYFLLEKLSHHNVIPVISIDRSKEHLTAVSQLKNNKIITSDIIAFRITPEDFQSYPVIEEEIKEDLDAIFNSFKSVDLIFDCRVCSKLDPKKTSKEILNFSHSFLDHYKVRRLIVTGSSLPASIGEILPSNSECYIDRHEINIFKALDKNKISFIFGDYTTVSPDYADIDIAPEIMQNVMTAKLSYSLENQHYFIRGGSLKTKGREQYLDMANTICSKAFYRGSKYSFGDEYLDKKSRGEGGNCAPNSVIKPSVNAHITYIVRDAAI